MLEVEPRVLVAGSTSFDIRRGFGFSSLVLTRPAAVSGDREEEAAMACGSLGGGLRSGDGARVLRWVDLGDTAPSWAPSSPLKLVRTGEPKLGPIARLLSSSESLMARSRTAVSSSSVCAWVPLERLEETVSRDWLRARRSSEVEVWRSRLDDGRRRPGASSGVVDERRRFFDDEALMVEVDDSLACEGVDIRFGEICSALTVATSGGGGGGTSVEGAGGGGTSVEGAGDGVRIGLCRKGQSIGQQDGASAEESAWSENAPHRAALWPFHRQQQ
jgi:hypothetical protein